jgi:hypothetical protein
MELAVIFTIVDNKIFKVKSYNFMEESIQNFQQYKKDISSKHTLIKDFTLSFSWVEDDDMMYTYRAELVIDSFLKLVKVINLGFHESIDKEELQQFRSYVEELRKSLVGESDN